ncbi:MAG: dual specificity protein phosphatase 23 [Candidatus Sumerlaeota bacterium]|nr:dual specificity protein phosphatase 23 [Candidatus Sumerlaeota bacterium]
MTRQPESSGLPLNFSYLIEGRLAGCATPAWSACVNKAFTALYEEGIRAVVSLDSDSDFQAHAKEFGFEYFLSPIPDFSVPSLPQVEECLRFIESNLKADKPVAVHCRAGMGRTGTILACYLIRHEGKSAQDAIARIRQMRPGSIETEEQEEFIQDYERHARGKRGGK